MEISPFGFKFKVLDAKKSAEYLLRTGIFKLHREMPGTDGACMIMLRSVDGISPAELVLHQPHQSHLNEWKVTSGCELHLCAKDIEMLEAIHSQMRQSGVTVSDWQDRPWGGQFWLQDANDNYFSFTND